MFYENNFKVTLKDAETAAAALEIMKAHLTVDFEKVDNTIEASEVFAYYYEDFENVVSELVQNLAENLSTEKFSFKSFFATDCDDYWFDGSYENGELKIKTTYFSNGFGHIFCCECDEEVAYMDDNTEEDIRVVSANGKLIASKEELEKGKTFICPECGEEIDLSDWVSISTKNIKTN